MTRTGNMPKAISIMYALVIDQSCGKIEVDMEIAYEDGTIRNLRLPLRRAIRVDLDTIYEEATDARPTG